MPTTPPPSTPTRGRPDAVKFPAAAIPPGDGGEHKRAAILAERLLGVDLDSEEFARCGDQGGWYFCSRCAPDDLRGPGPLLLHPHGHPAAGRPRYSWAPAPEGPAGAEFGTLLDVDAA